MISGYQTTCCLQTLCSKQIENIFDIQIEQHCENLFAICVTYSYQLHPTSTHKTHYSFPTNFIPHFPGRILFAYILLFIYISAYIIKYSKCAPTASNSVPLAINMPAKCINIKSPTATFCAHSPQYSLFLPSGSGVVP